MIYRESRSHCMDLETAYTQGCKKLDQSMQVNASINFAKLNCSSKSSDNFISQHSLLFQTLNLIILKDFKGL